MNNELISVIIPVYNSERYLSRAIKSVLNQTYKNYEIILIDDGSTDSSIRICDKFSKEDSRIRVIHQKNKGVSAARNTGIKIANGNYIAFLDADDEITTEALELMHNEMLNNEVDLVITNYTKILNNGKKILNNYNDRGKYKNIIDFISVNYQWGPCNKLIKKDKITKLFNDKIAVGEDALFFVENFKDCSYSYINKTTYYYYMIDNSAMHNKEITLKNLSFFNAFEKIILETDGIAKTCFMIHYIDCYYKYFVLMRDTNGLFCKNRKKYKERVMEYYKAINKNKKLINYFKILKLRVKIIVCDINEVIKRK